MHFGTVALKECVLPRSLILWVAWAFWEKCVVVYCTGELFTVSTGTIESVLG